MGTMPQVQVINKRSPVKSRPGLASRIAVIGAFDTDETNPILCYSIDEAYQYLGTDLTYKGVSCLDKLFYGASTILAVNTATKSGSGNNITVDKTLTPAKLTSALAKISGEDFDMLFVAEIIPSTLISIITDFLDNRYKNKIPAEYVCYSDFNANLAGDYCNGLLNQKLIVNDTLLSEVDSAAYYCGVIASLNVGNSMTMKTVPQVTGVSPELSFENGGNGLSLLESGVTTFRCLDRSNNHYIVVNSEQPNGLYLYINRSRDFVVKEMALHQFLGDRNRPKSLNEIKQELDRVKDRCVNTLDLLADIEYDVIKKNSKCVDVNITKLLFDDIITEINVYITLKVE